MANAKRDQNDRPVSMGVSSSDGTTTLMLHVDSVTGYLLVDMSTDTTSVPTGIHRIDQNDIPTCYGISSVDGVTLIPIRTDPNGRLMTEFA